MIFKMQFTIPLRPCGAQSERRNLKKKPVEEMIQINGALYATHVDVHNFRVPHINI